MGSNIKKVFHSSLIDKEQDPNDISPAFRTDVDLERELEEEELATKYALMTPYERMLARFDDERSKRNSKSKESKSKRKTSKKSRKSNRK